MAASDSGTHQMGHWLRTRKHQIATVMLGASLLATGAVATFLSTNGAGSAALIAGGTFLVALALLNERIALLKIGDIEFHLREAARQLSYQAADLAAAGNGDAAEQLRRQAQALLVQISPVARAYEEVRRTRSPLPERIAEMSKVIGEAKRYSGEHHPSAEAVRAIFHDGGDGERLYAIALMQADPEVADIELILNVISSSHSAFEQYNALVAAQVALANLSEADKIRLATAIRRQLDHGGYISRSTDRRLIAEQILTYIGEHDLRGR